MIFSLLFYWRNKEKENCLHWISDFPNRVMSRLLLAYTQVHLYKLNAYTYTRIFSLFSSSSSTYFFFLSCSFTFTKKGESSSWSPTSHTYFFLFFVHISSVRFNISLLPEISDRISLDIRPLICLFINEYICKQEKACTVQTHIHTYSQVRDNYKPRRDEKVRE